MMTLNVWVVHHRLWLVHDDPYWWFMYFLWTYEAFLKPNETDITKPDCKCPLGFTDWVAMNADEQLECIDVDECSDQTHECSPIGVCDNTEGSYICTCPEYYFGDGLNCFDIDECFEETNNCLPEGSGVLMCVFVLGSAREMAQRSQHSL